MLRRLESADSALDDESRRAQLSFVFVGAGYAGVEALAELSDLADDAMRYYPRLRDVPRRWVLVDAAPKILPEIPSRLGEYAARELTERGVEIHVGTTLESVSADEAVLGDGTRIPTHTLVWTAGVRANPLLRELGVPLDDRGRVEVDELLRVRGVPGVWALGDCARVPNTRSETPDPPTCQHALRQARRLAKNLSGDPKPYGYRMLGQVATLGRYKGIADVVGLRFRGFLGWFITAPTTCTSSRWRSGVRASSSTGPSRSSSGATSRSSGCSGRRKTSAPSAARSAPCRFAASSSARLRTGRHACGSARARPPS